MWRRPKITAKQAKAQAKRNMARAQNKALSLNKDWGLELGTAMDYINIQKHTPCQAKNGPKDHPPNRWRLHSTKQLTD